MSADAVLRVQGLSARYGHVEALKGIDFELRGDEIVTLIGANGAGKTSTLRAVSGLIPDTRGTVEFAGHPVSGWSASRIAALGLVHVPEGRRLFTRMTVMENLELGAYRRGVGADLDDDLERVFELFPRVKERLHQLAGTLSGGEQQMVAIGRGLMARPKVLLLDEPSMGLAPLLVQEVFKAIQEIHRQGTPVLLVEQNANQALHIASRAYVLETGTIGLTGTGKQLLADPRVRSAYLGE